MSLLPHNSTAFEQALLAACDLNIDAQIIHGVADSARCPPNFLPWLAWALKVDGWEAAESEAQQRELIHEAIPVHKTKGTVGAVRRVLKAVRVNSQFREWQQIPGAAPYTFELTAWANDNRPGEGSILSPQLYARLRALVDAAKNERSHYQFRLGAGFDGGLRLANAANFCALVRRSAEAMGVPINAQQGLQVANAARARIVVRGTMEAVL
ncbi:phage tail protein I [Pseudomonas donghuensis]|uniref:phage tail protein I n=1 Tax=Pseudomonas donghuensis TaxID=1163398 RepID=UPI000C2A3DDE|nr:phage tail protein I [Pseudomonas donghuensis]MBF4207958.1 phage tail protein I [Pseudomonas donghuensis]PJY94597.1 phage tail protein I [Pseudomonas donghuensis]WKY29547.1 phage tail protein I [Pseudomonas donghuensis]WSE84590.1 phage tail protein I [Pseudomonas donghuensis]